MKRHLAALAVLALLVTGCSSTSGDDSDANVSSAAPSASAAAETQAPPAEPLDLTGEWVQTNSNSETAYQAATITGAEIIVNWVTDAESTALYWAGTYAPPTEDTDVYAWDSANDTAQTGSAMLASGDATKTFTFEGDVLKYELTAMGTTMTVEMSRR